MAEPGGSGLVGRPGVAPAPSARIRLRHVWAFGFEPLRMRIPSSKPGAPTRWPARCLTVGPRYEGPSRGSGRHSDTAGVEMVDVEHALAAPPKLRRPRPDRLDRVDGRTSRADAGRGSTKLWSCPGIPTSSSTGRRNRRLVNAGSVGMPYQGESGWAYWSLFGPTRRASPQRVRRQALATALRERGYPHPERFEPESPEHAAAEYEQMAQEQHRPADEAEPPGSAMQRSPLRSAVELRALRQAA